MRTRILVLTLSVVAVVSIFVYFGVSAQDIVVQPVSPLPPPSPTIETRHLDPAAQRALEYVAGQRKLSSDQLTIRYREEVTFPTLERSFVRFVIAAPGDATSAETELLVDVATDAVETNVDAWIVAERTAYTEKYGKLNPGLYERLQQIDDQERLPVAIWVARTEQDKPVEELLEAAAGDDPAALDALRTQGVPWAVADEKQAQAIHERYAELLNAEVAQRVAPLAAELHAQGYAVTEFAGMPALSTLLNKPEIEKLAGHPLVAELFLIEAEGRAEADVAIATDRVPQVWQRGYNGTGVKIAILEAGNINQTARNCLTVTATRDPGMGSNDHKSRVAAIAACNSAALPGVAKGASVLDAGTDTTQQGFATTMTWAAQTQTADVINMSLSFEADQYLQFTDRVTDYWVRAEKSVAVVAAGNIGQNQSPNVTSPAKAWNAITVGRASDQNTASWSDDVLDGDSAYVNPATGVEKPELAAPGTNINTVVAPPDSGTSYAAPQVAGAAALLMHRNAALKDQPSAVKAILMASAVHNLEGNRTLSGSDGAGAIDAALADQIVQLQGSTGQACNQPCWWQKNTTSWDPSFSNPLYYTFAAMRGERIRVAIAWLSNADGPVYNYNSDTLYDNFELKVLQPTGQGLFEVTSSLSLYNNFEIVEFTAPDTSQYQIEVSRRSGSSADPGVNQLGIAWSKQATYLPDVRQNADGWTSTVAVRNDGAEQRPVRVTYFYASGVYAGETNTTLNQDQNWRITPPGGMGYGAAIVDGSEDLSVVVLQEHANPYTLDAYAGVAMAQTTVHIPIVQKGNSGWYSDLLLYNPNAQNATATLTFTPAPGLGNAWSASYGIGANGQVRLYTGNLPALGTKFVGSVQVSADRPLAVAATQYNGASQLMAWSSSQPLAATLYAPLIQNNNAGWLSGLTLRAPGGNLPISAAYRVGNTGGGCAGETWWNNPQIIYPAPQGNPPGCGATPNAIFSDGGDMAATVNQLQGTLNATTYEAIAAPALTASIPKVQRDAYWSDGFVVMNVNTTPANVTVRLYNSGGTLNSTPFTNHPLGANQSLTVLSQIPQGFDGSALVTADQPMAVIANAWRPGSGSGDVIGSYPASHR